MLVRDEPYQPLGPEWLSERNDEAHGRRLITQLERFGHTVVLDPVASHQKLSGAAQPVAEWGAGYSGRRIAV